MINPFYRVKFRVMKSIMDKHRRTPFDAARSDMFALHSDDDPTINNSWYFGGHSMEGESLTMRLAYRNNGCAEVFVICILKDGRFLATEKQLFRIEESPLKVENLIPGRDWRVTFDGELKNMGSGEYLHCSFSFKFTARLPVFYPMTDGDFTGMAKSFASQRWTPKFFRSLSSDTGVGARTERSKQYHYEQTGRLEGELMIGSEHFGISLAGIRDRAFGSRDWNYMDSHIWLVAATDKGEALNLSIVNYPHAKRLYTGYTDIGSDRNSALASYEVLSYDHNGGKGPDDLAFNLTFENGKTFTVKAHRTHSLYTEFDGGNFYFHEGIGSFDINGIKARGTIEIGFNRDRNRWGSY